MCNCANEVRQNLIKASGADNIIMPIELTSGRIFIEAEKITIKNGKTKRKIVPVTLAICPFCGKKYPEQSLEEGDGVHGTSFAVNVRKWRRGSDENFDSYISNGDIWTSA
jgi:hypothetical protein